MASCSNLSRLPSSASYGPSKLKAQPVPSVATRRLIEPFHRLKHRANLFRRKNYSSQTDITSSSPPGDSRPSLTTNPASALPSHLTGALKRSNSMICPQQRLQTFLTHHPSHRNSVCLELTDGPTNDYRLIKSSSAMNHIDESSLEQGKPFASPTPRRTEQTSIVLPSPVNLISHEQKQQLIVSSIVISPSPADTIRARRQPHANTILLQQRQSVCSSIDEPFFDCQQQTPPMKANEQFDMSLLKISTCTMTGKSLVNLHQCLSSTSSEEKGVQTSFHKSKLSSTSLSSSSSSSVQTDSLENRPATSHKWPHLQERLIGEQTCIYWVNYLGSTAIKQSHETTSIMPIHAITRLKQSTQYARALPIIGLSISSRGVEFLEHTKDRTVICFHDIKSIHCACQDQDLRYFAYVTREQRLVTRTSPVPMRKQLPPPSPSLSISSAGEFHHYCHVFVVKNETMSTEIMLTFGQAFDIAYRLHHRGNPSTQMHTDQCRRKVLPTFLSSSSSSSSSIDERKVSM